MCFIFAWCELFLTKRTKCQILKVRMLKHEVLKCSLSLLAIFEWFPIEQLKQIGQISLWWNKIWGVTSNIMLLITTMSYAKVRCTNMQKTVGYSQIQFIISLYLLHIFDTWFLFFFTHFNWSRTQLTVKLLEPLISSISLQFSVTYKEFLFNINSSTRSCFSLLKKVTFWPF